MITSAGPPSQTLPTGLTVGPITLEISIVEIQFSGVVIAATVVERDSQWTTTRIHAFFARLPGEEDADLLRRGLKIMVCHEVDEKIVFDGYRVFDPHIPSNVERHY